MATIDELRARVTERKQAEIEQELVSEAHAELGRVQTDLDAKYSELDALKAKRDELNAFINPPQPEPVAEEVQG